MHLSLPATVHRLTRSISPNAPTAVADPRGLLACVELPWIGHRGTVGGNRMTVTAHTGRKSASCYYRISHQKVANILLWFLSAHITIYNLHITSYHPLQTYNEARFKILDLLLP